MATGNLLLGQASGAVGSLVFARVNGQQVTKARQEQVRYSNTLAQAIQRICISTAGQAYRHIQEVCCRSFQGVQPGKATHDEFMKRNVRMLRQIIRQADAQSLTYSDLRYFTPVANDTLLPNTYIVSSGSLPTITTNIDSHEPTHARLTGVGATYKDIISFYGLQRGDILTFVFMQPDSSGIVRARSARIVLDPWSPIGGKVSLDVPFLAAGNMVNYPNPDNSGEFTYLVNDSGDIVYSLVNSDVPIIAAGVFVSRRAATGSWLHSDCLLNVYDNSDILNKFTLQQAIEVASGVPVTAISTDYLNNAGTEKLPAHQKVEYEILEYLQSDGEAFIDTGYIGKTYSGIYIKYSYVASGAAAICGVYNPGGHRKDAFFISSQSGLTSSKIFIANSGNEKIFDIQINLNTTYEARINYLNNQLIIVNDIVATYITDHGLLVVPIPLFARYKDSESSVVISQSKIYSVIITEGSNVVREYKAARKISTSELGLLDIINNNFIGNAGEGSFIPGNIVGFI